jgi:hypothetical protein
MSLNTLLVEFKSCSTVDCQQLKLTGARSAGRSAACTDSTPTAYVRSMTTWEIPSTFKLDMEGEERLPQDAWQGPGRRMAACWALPCLSRRPTPSSFTAAALGPARAHGEAWNRAANGGRKWMGAPMTGACEPHCGSPGWQLLPRCTLDLRLGACVGLWGEHVHGDSTLGRQWVAKS